MPSRGLSWSHASAESLVRLAGRDQRQARRLLVAVRQYAAQGTGDVKKLEGSREEWRLRVGDWRIIFTRRSDAIVVLDILNRRDAYR